MSDNDRSNLGLLPGLAIGALTSNLAMPSRTEEGRTPLSTLLDLVSLGLAAAATVIIFGIASFSLLYTSEGMPRGSGIRDRGVEVKPVRSGVFPYTHAYRPPLPAEAECQARLLRRRLAPPHRGVRQPVICKRPRSVGRNRFLSRCRLAPAKEARCRMPRRVPQC